MMTKQDLKEAYEAGADSKTYSGSYEDGVQEYTRVETFEEWYKEFLFRRELAKEG
jgi:hypothetical protein